MSSKRSIRWPNLLEELVVAILVSALGWIIGILWNAYQVWSERALIIIGSAIILVTITVIYERFRAERISVAFTEPEYENILTELARDHNGSIAWVTKTSIWADVPEAYSGRLATKIEGVRTGRISQMKYIVHLGYWRQYVKDDLDRGSHEALDLYNIKLKTLLRHVEDYELCPPAKVQILVGEVREFGPPHRFGIYKSPSNTLLVFGYDVSMGSEVLPRLVLKGQSELVRYFQNQFDEQWETYVDRMISAPNFPELLKFPEALRKSLVDTLRDELDWIASISDRHDGEFTNITPLRQAKQHLDQGRTVTLSCPQKVCISGDYGDMYEGGITLTAAVSTRPHLTIRKIQEDRSLVRINYPDAGSQSRLQINGWPLVEVFQKELDRLDEVYSVEIFPTELINVGLGSSGAASILLVATLALAENRTISIRELIQEAYNFETKLASCPCGPQDHAVAALGGLRLIEFPSLHQRVVPHFSVWNTLSFWTTGERRQARKIIPKTIDNHTQTIWDIKRQLTRNIADGFSSNDLEAIIEVIRSECDIQERLQMLTEIQLKAINIVTRNGGAAKVSGAGGGGILLVVVPEKEHLPSISAALQEIGFSEILLKVDTQGLAVEPGG